jgi:DNA-binding NtrC family response regulator
MESRGRVLIASSSAGYRETLADILQLWCLEPTFVSTVDEVRAFLERQAPVLVICEDQLAEGGCQDVLDALSAAKSSTRLVALVHDDAGYSEARQHGAFDAIPLPLQRSDLQWVVIRALQAKTPAVRKANFRNGSAHPSKTDLSVGPSRP